MILKSNTLLSINVYYSPQSFGGATIVAEEVNAILTSDYIWDVMVITSYRDDSCIPYHIRKYKSKGVTIIAINLPKDLSYEDFYINDKIADIISDIAIRFNPSITHIHSIQTMGASFMRNLSLFTETKIVLTLHDCWWICERQFMINREGRYCFQQKIDPMTCMYCVDDINRYEKRSKYLSMISKYVDMFLFPSDFHRELHITNGYPAEKCFTNKNGVRLPNPEYKKQKSPVIRFGFTGGPGKIKGYDLILKVFQEIELNNYELVVVDGAKNLGKSWSHAFKNSNIKGKIRIMPAFTQDTMDDFYKHIDVLLFPSQWKESFGLTVREALVRNIWVISTDGGGTTEDLVDNENAYIIPISSNTDHLKEAIFKCIDKEWAFYENEYAEDIISYHRQAENLYKLYLNLLNTEEKDHQLAQEV